jgi:RNA polymerase sigma-70 factor (ECF subfamily)
MMTDLELVQQLKQGNEKAFEQIFNKYFEGLCLFAESIAKDHEIAQDIVEEIFLHLWVNCKVRPIEISVKSYLYQSVYNNTIKYLSRKQKNEIPVRDFELSNTTNVNQFLTSDYPIANLIAHELEEKAIEIINALPDQCRQIYLLNRDEDLKYQEIAERLQITVGTVKTQMSRAFSKLRENLKDFLYLFF